MENQPTDTRENQASRELIGTEKALAWHGFGSPVGLGILVVSVSVAAVLFRFAFVGF